MRRTSSSATAEAQEDTNTEKVIPLHNNNNITTQLKVSAASFTPSFINTSTPKEEKKDDTNNTSPDTTLSQPEISAQQKNISNVTQADNEEEDGWHTELQPQDKSNNNNNQTSSSSKYWNPLEQVDSALLSALLDNRERKAMFKLEQELINFINNDTIKVLEVGGVFNAIVLEFTKEDVESSTEIQRKLEEMTLNNNNNNTNNEQQQYRHIQ